MQRVNKTPSTVCALVRQGAFDLNPFVLIDVGASGGIARAWDVFRGKRRVYAFEPLVTEARQLTAQNQDPDVHYINAYVSGGNTVVDAVEFSSCRDSERQNHPYTRSSGKLAADLAADSGTHGSELAYTKERVTLDEFVVQRGIDNIDFIKIDTDGFDYDVLLGAQRMLAATNVMGLVVECQFHKPARDSANLFSKIDLYLQENGFSLYALETWNYTRAVLPGRFLNDIPAQTREGQVVWGDALYLRDVGALDYERRWEKTYETQKIIVLISLMELFNLKDCALEVALKYENVLRASDHWDTIAETLAPVYQGRKLGLLESRKIFSDFAKRKRFAEFPGFK